MANDKNTNNDTNTVQWVDERIAGLSPAENWQPDTGRALARLRQRQRSAGARRQIMKWGTAVACVAGLALVTFPTTRAATYQLCLDACAAVWPSLAATAEGAAAARGRAVASPPDSGSLSPESHGFRYRPDGLAPEFALPDADGRVIRLSDFRGKVVLLNFWATWCIPCKTEMPWFVEFQREYRDRGFTVLAVSLDEERWEAVKPFLSDLKPNFPVVVGNEEVADLFGGIQALPTTFLIDREGVVRSQHMGLVSAKEYEAGIEKLLNQVSE